MLKIIPTALLGIMLLFSLASAVNAPRNDFHFQDSDLFLNPVRSPAIPTYWDYLRNDPRYNPILEKIIKCESAGNPLAFNAEYGATGLFQVIYSTQKSVNKALNRKLNYFNPLDNIDAGLWLYEKYGTRPWLASRYCQE